VSTIRVFNVPKDTILNIIEFREENGYVRVVSPEIYSGWIKRDLLMPLPPKEIVVAVLAAKLLKNFFSI